MSEVTVVTTFNQEGMEQYGNKCIDSFLAYWPENYKLLVYADGCEITQTDPRLKVLDMESTIPNLVAFKKHWAHEPKVHGQINNEYNYRYDAIKFSHKVFAYCHASGYVQTRYLIWLDADTVTFKPVPFDLINQLLPEETFVAYLGRPGMYTEAGFLAFDLKNQFSKEFFFTFERFYLAGEVFHAPEWHDSFIFDMVRGVMSAQGKIECHDLGVKVPSMHPFVNSFLGDYMDHLKGPKRKVDGKSYSEDYVHKTAIPKTASGN